MASAYCDTVTVGGGLGVSDLGNATAGRGALELLPEREVCVGEWPGYRTAPSR